MDSKFTAYMSSQVGDLVLEFEGEKLVSLSITDKNTVKTQDSGIAKSEKIVNVVLEQLKNYFSSAIPFSGVSLAPDGTSFQKSVWKELSKIPLSETRTYGDIARKLNSSPRAVGNACRKNPVAIIIPCHRVISAKGIGGYAGETEGKEILLKRWLLNHEGVQV